MFVVSSSFGFLFDFALRSPDGVFSFVTSRLKFIVRHALAAITARERRRSRCKTVWYRFGLHQLDRNVDVAPRGVGICTGRLVRGVHNGLRDFALQARQADVEPS